MDDKSKKEEVKPQVAPPPPAIKPRPMVVHGSTYRIDTPVGTAFITVNTNEDHEPLEVFINVGKAGTDVYAMATALGRVISTSLRFASYLSPHERVKEMINQMQGIGGTRSMGFGKERIRSLPDAVAKVLAMHFQMNGHAKDKEVIDQLKSEQPKLTSETVQPSLIASPAATNGLLDICPSCGEAMLAHEEGCSKCYGCGYAAC